MPLPPEKEKNIYISDMAKKPQKEIFWRQMCQRAEGRLMKCVRQQKEFFILPQ